jgi:hypothetical protein
MPKRPIWVTLNTDNLTWLRARAVSGKRRSVSEPLEEIVTAARTSADGRIMAWEVTMPSPAARVNLDRPGRDPGLPLITRDAAILGSALIDAVW